MPKSKTLSCPKPTYSLHCSSLLGLVTLSDPNYMFLVNPTQEPTIMETTGKPLTLGRRTDRMQPQQPPARASLGSVTGEARPSVHRGSRPVTEAPVFQVGSCQNYGPFLGTLNNRCRIILGAQKGTIILTTTHMAMMKHDLVPCCTIV